MDHTPILPNIGIPCPTDLLNPEKLDGASLGEALHAAAFILQYAGKKMANPSTFTEVPTFSQGAGSDWSGYQSQTGDDTSDDDADSAGSLKTPATVVPPERYYDSLPAIGDMLSQVTQSTDVMMANYARYFQAAEHDQVTYFGAPFATSGFTDAKHYLRDTMKLSAATAAKHVDRAAYVTLAPGKNPEEAANLPVFARMAAAFINGRIPAENIDRFIAMDQDLVDYAAKTGQTTDYKNAVLQAFEPTLVETAETSTPDEVSRVKKRWVDRIAHAMNADGPSPSQTLRKQPDNAIKTRDHADGSGHISMHATPDLYAQFKNFKLHMLNHHGTPPDLPDEIAALFPTQNKGDNDAEDAADNTVEPAVATNTPDAALASQSTIGDTAADNQRTAVDGNCGIATLEPITDSDTAGAHTDPESLRETGTDSQESLPTRLEDTAPLGLTPDSEPPLPNPDAIVAEDEHGNPITAQRVNAIDQMSNGQKLGAMLIGMFNTLLTMDPTEAGIKKSHGSSAQLVLVQDIQTAHHTLGLPELPAAVRRPPGVDGILPPVITAPNPNNSSPPDCHKSSADHDDFEPPPDDDFISPHDGYVNPVAWTPYQSEVINHGPMHPKDAEILACNAELVGQIWNGPDTVLHQKRTHRLFTPTQRRAILARDRGCQAPGCTVPGIDSEIHHIKAWEHGGTTDEPNATTLCAHHHGAIHIGKWRIVKHHGMTFFQPAPWLDPYQPLLRNVYWNT
ncbi:MAG: HNH endonuclease [Micrococcaceae bacterium]|nr:HNH endonuclease [Micrococcaceae bacterium]